jgi:hypothetical protein
MNQPRVNNADLFRLLYMTFLFTLAAVLWASHLSRLTGAVLIPIIIGIGVTAAMRITRYLRRRRTADDPEPVLRSEFARIAMAHPYQVWLTGAAILGLWTLVILHQLGNAMQVMFVSSLVLGLLLRPRGRAQHWLRARYDEAGNHRQSEPPGTLPP